MTLQEKLAAAEHQAASLRRMLAAYPDVKEVDGRYEADVPFERCTTVEVVALRGDTCARFGDELVPFGTVWSSRMFAIDSLLIRLLENDSARAALCKVLREMIGEET